MERRAARLLILLVMVLSVRIGAIADADRIYTGLFSNLAIKGYDAVAYFIEGQPVRGHRDFTLTYLGAEWRFSSADNLRLFSANPEAYAPQYGGYCAYAVSQGDLASAEPEFWTIHDGKLYLNFSRRVNADWRRDMLDYISQANGNWPQIIQD